ncbi:MAG: Flp pilus assembly protein CpaB [Paracoccaceae bacterium]
MRIVFALILFIGIGLAGFAVYVAMQRFNYYESALAETRRNAAPNIEVAQVIVAARDLQYGQPLVKDDIRKIDWPANSVPKGTFTKVKDLIGKGDDAPRYVLRRMQKDEPILEAKVTEFGQDAGLRSVLGRGKRAFTIQVDVLTGVSGFIRPGDRVDVFWSGTDGEKRFTKLLQEDMKIIAVDQIVDEDRVSPTIARTVTVEVSPQIVAELAQAQSSGRLSLSLRGVEDTAEVGVVEVAQDAITGFVKTEKVRKRVCTIRERRNGEIVETPIPCK